jgi:molecular chaperone DnaK
MNAGSAPVLGIDLGTSTCCAAWVDDEGTAHVVPTAEGRMITPSVIHFDDAGAPTVGDAAARLALVDPEHVVRHVKRHMGEDEAVITVQGRAWSAQELSASILTKLRSDAERVLGPVQRAVITVPAYFNGAQRAATREAGALAGLDVLSVVNEPTAAAIADALTRATRGPRRILCFDLGGGTFDATVLDVDGTTLRTLGSDGNAHLGGKDWDDALAAYVAEQAIPALGADPRETPVAHAELMDRCVAAKLVLSTRPRTVVAVRVGERRITVPVTRSAFEAATDHLVGTCLQTCELLLERLGLGWGDLQEIVLAGGATRMPMVREALARRSGRPVSGELAPETCVAVGAAYIAVLRHADTHPAHARVRELLGGVGAPTAVHVIDVSTHPFGVMAYDIRGEECVREVVPGDVPLPCARQLRLAYVSDGMTSVQVEVTEGRGTRRDEVVVIGRLVLDNLPPRPRGTPIDLTYRVSHDGVLRVEIKDVETGRTRYARLRMTGSLDRAPSERPTSAGNG